MTIKEIHPKAGSLSGYMGYIFLVFGWYFLDNRFGAFQTAHPGNALLSLVDWGINLVLGSRLWAVVFGGVYAQQRSHSEGGMGRFLHPIKAYALRFLRANLHYVFPGRAADPGLCHGTQLLSSGACRRLYLIVCKTH